MRPGVVDVGCQLDEPSLLTLNAERMRNKDPSSKSLPLVAITSSGRRPSSLSPAPISISRELRVTSLACGLVSFAILGAKRDRLAAAWVLLMCACCQRERLPRNSNRDTRRHDRRPSPADIDVGKRVLMKYLFVPLRQRREHSHTRLRMVSPAQGQATARDFFISQTALDTCRKMCAAKCAPPVSIAPQGEGGYLFIVGSRFGWSTERCLLRLTRYRHSKARPPIG